MKPLTRKKNLTLSLVCSELAEICLIVRDTIVDTRGNRKKRKMLEQKSRTFEAFSKVYSNEADKNEKTKNI